MSRRHAAEKREIIPDPKFGNVVVSKFMNAIMYDGKKSVAEKIVYDALDSIETKTKQNPDPVVGVQRLAELCRSVSRPVVAIGGITPENAGETLEPGARYVAVVSALPKFLEGR